MFKNMSRAQRRYQRARIKNNRRNYWGYGKYGWRNYCNHGIEEMPKDVAGWVTRTPTPCSCSMCGNPRHNVWQNKKERLTLQERKAFEAYKDNMEEIDDS